MRIEFNLATAILAFLVAFSMPDLIEWLNMEAPIMIF